jgi:hypothetical protein
VRQINQNWSKFFFNRAVLFREFHCLVGTVGFRSVCWLSWLVVPHGLRFQNRAAMPRSLFFTHPGEANSIKTGPSLLVLAKFNHNRSKTDHIIWRIFNRNWSKTASPPGRSKFSFSSSPFSLSQASAREPRSYTAIKTKILQLTALLSYHLLLAHLVTMCVSNRTEPLTEGPLKIYFHQISRKLAHEHTNPKFTILRTLILATIVCSAQHLVNTWQTTASAFLRKIS